MVDSLNYGIDYAAGTYFEFPAATSRFSDAA
jgi:hypothetical protein